MKVGFTGTRHGMSGYQKSCLAALLAGNSHKGVENVPLDFPTGVSAWVHGACIGGDVEFHRAVRLAIEGSYIVCRPSTSLSTRVNSVVDDADFSFPPEPPLIRDERIVRDVRLLIAAPLTMEEFRRSGTWATVRRARIRNIPIIYLWRFPRNANAAD